MVLVVPIIILQTFRLNLTYAYNFSAFDLLILTQYKIFSNSRSKRIFDPIMILLTPIKNLIVSKVVLVVDVALVLKSRVAIFVCACSSFYSSSKTSFEGVVS